MKVLLVLLLSTVSLSAFARTFQFNTKATCVVYGYNDHNMYGNDRFSLQFSELTSVENSDGDVFEFGVGTAVYDGKVEMMNLNKQLISVPIKVALTVKIDSDLKRKKLSAVIQMYNIFKQRTETIVVKDQTPLNKSITDRFDYFQEGFLAANSRTAPRDQITGSTIFCNVE